MDSRQGILSNFAACPLCGSLMAGLMALLGENSLDKAIQDGPWLTFEWQPSMEDILVGHYNWDFAPQAERYSARCPSCLRRFVYRQEGANAHLDIERRPGFRT